jgi:hypothetical protein
MNNIMSPRRAPRYQVRIANSGGKERALGWYADFAATVELAESVLERGYADVARIIDERRREVWRAAANDARLHGAMISILVCSRTDDQDA